ncbi:MAG: acyltransferase [Betaproteobacteria bacterium]
MSNRFAFCPWDFFRSATPDERRAQQQFHDALVASGRVKLGERCYISPLAGFLPAKVVLGDDCYVAGYAYVTTQLTTGRQCTINPFAVVRGIVTMGSDVRVGSHASILGFNHNHDDLTRPMHTQGQSSKGIVIGDDVWIGTGAIIVDGVMVGSHSIVGAGAVVTKDVHEWAIVGGNPARVLRDRRDGAPADVAASVAAIRMAPAMPEPVVEAPVAAPAVTPAAPAAAPAVTPAAPAASVAPAIVSPSLAATLAAIGRRAAAQWPEILKRSEIAFADGPGYTDVPGMAPRGLRGLNDAIEIAAAFGAVPPVQSKDELIGRLQSYQNPADGMPFDPLLPRPPTGANALDSAHGVYIILSTGYALECLGAHHAQPIRVVHDLPPNALRRILDALPWQKRAWTCGGWIDAIGTALWFNQRHFKLTGPVAPLFEWLDARCHAHTGLWGESTPDEGWLQPVNGFYRLTRGTYAHFGRPVPYPEIALDSVLAHIAQNEGFAARNVTACNLLDTIHPLWLLQQQTDHRRDEALAFVRAQIPAIAARWVDGQGFAFAAGGPPSLQGTEMWLATLYVAADALGLASELPYAPKGVHWLRPPA